MRTTASWALRPRVALGVRWPFAGLVLAAVLHGGASRDSRRVLDEVVATRTPVKRPTRFEANAGQWDERVRFVARQGRATLFVTDTGMTVGLRGRSAAAVTFTLSGANPIAPQGEEVLATRSHFFLGNDPSKWRTNVPSHARVRARHWAPGVDAVWYGENGRVEYDLEVAEGVDARDLELVVEGADRLELTADGALAALTTAGTLVQRPPRVIQAGRELPSRYELSGSSRVRFAIDGYDPRLALLIDPALAYSFAFGGSDEDSGSAIAVDASGSACVTGWTRSVDFPTRDGLKPAGGERDIFVTKLTADGSGIVHSTYLGGGDADFGEAIALDASGAIYIAGDTTSADFPTRGAVQPALRGGGDAFVAKLSPDGSALVYATYLGGGKFEIGQGIAVDAGGSAYVTGGTTSKDFPTKGAAQATPGGAFVTKLSATGSELVYSTFLGGSGSDRPRGIAVDASGSAYVTGQTSSLDFPTHDPLKPALRDGDQDAFVTKLSADGSTFVFSTYLGGSKPDEADGIAVDASGSAYVTGYTDSPDFPARNAGPATAGSAFVSKLTAGGTELAYSMLLRSWWGQRVAVDTRGRAYVAGWSGTGDVSMQPPLPVENSLGFLSVLDAAGASFVYATSLAFEPRGLAIDPVGDPYILGVTGDAKGPNVVVTKIALDDETGACAKLDCGPYRCVRGMCLARCASSDDCASPASCSSTTQKCEMPYSGPPMTDQISDPLCSVAHAVGAASAQKRSPWSLLLGAAALGVYASRRRRK